MSEQVVAAARARLSPRQRAKRNRTIQYAILGVIVVVIAFVANWPQIVKVFFSPEIVVKTLAGSLWSALWHTITYSAGGFVLGLVAATFLALMRLSEVAPYRWIAGAYIEFFRGLPSLIVFIALSLLPLAFGGFRIPLDPYGVVWLALGIVGAAYMAETIRAGIQAVPRGQVEAARSLGMSARKTTRKIVLPQAFRIMIPPLTNELIMLIKDSSLVYVIGLTPAAFELTMFGRTMANNEANLAPLVLAGFGYLIITLPLSFLVRRMETKKDKR